MPETLSPFLFGFNGLRPTRETVKLLRETRAAGVLLLSRNIRTARQTRDLIRELQERVGRPLLISIDHEGGWVIRSAGIWTTFPGNAALGRVHPRLTRSASRHMARELAALGIGLNLAPVADVQGARYNPGIGVRSFGDNSELVSKLTIQFICGHNDHKIASCVKHFPGKGDASVDAHLDLPVIRSGRRRFTYHHLPPFAAAISAKVPALMTTHAVYPALDPNGRPATISTAIAGDLLRGKMGFKGLLISDDLGMGAIVRHQSIPQAAVRTLKAGHDLLIIAEPSPAQQASATAVRGTSVDPASARRLSRFVHRFSRPASGPLPRPDPRLPLRIARQAVSLLRRGRVPLPLQLTERPRIRLYWPDLREVHARFAFEGGPAGPLRLVQERLSHWPARVKYNTMPVLHPRRMDMEETEDLTLFFCFDALLFRPQREALLRVSRTAKNMVAILLKNPWDKSLLKPATTAITAYGFRNCQLEVLMERLR